MRQRNSFASCAGWKVLPAKFGDTESERFAICYTKLDMQNPISFQFPRTFRRRGKKREKEAPAYKYKKHLSAQETLLCHFANDSYLYVQEKSDLMHHAGNDVPFCLALAVALCSCTWLAGGLPWHRDLSSAAQGGPEAFMFPSYTFL